MASHSRPGCKSLGRKSIVRPCSKPARHTVEILEGRRFLSGQPFVGPLAYANSAPIAASQPITQAAPEYATLSNGTLTIDASISGGPVTLQDSGAVITVSSPMGLSTFADGSVFNIVFAGTAGNDTLTLSSSITKPLLMNGGTGSDTLNVNAGTFTASADLHDSTPNLTVNVGTGTGSPSVGFASTQHLTALNIASGATVTVSQGGFRVLVTQTLSFGLTGKLNLADNSMIVRGNSVGVWAGTVYTGISGRIQSGRNGGGWGGNGIVTTEAAAVTGNFASIGVATAGQVKGVPATGTAVWGGETVTGNDTLVRYTCTGDANLDGKINVDDYTRIDFNVLLGTTGWYNGDFNYDGKINVDDYTIIDFNVGIQGHSFSNAGGFESPRFATAFINAFDPTVVGNLRGQDAATGVWRESTTDPFGSEGAITGTAVVENKAGGGGSDLQDVKVTRTQYDNRWAPTMTAYNQNNNNPVVHIDWSMKVMHTTTDPNKLGPFFGIEAFDRISGPTLRIGGLGVDATTGEILYEDGTQGINITPEDATVALGVYNNFSLTLDFRTHTYSISVNGQQFVTGISFLSAGVTGLSDADLAALQAAPNGGANADGVAYFDNYSVTSALQ
jgi:hypothetical protein